MSERSVSVRLRSLWRRYGDLVAVGGVDLDVYQGEFFSLIGPSGCGKTTTLRMIAGLDDPTSGEIEVEGRDITSVPPHKRPVNTVFQSYALFPHLSVFDNVAFGLRERRVPKEEARRRVGEMLELVDLDQRHEARPSELSGGQQQRVALARALVLNPRVLLLDEPLGALDLKLRRRMQVLLKRVQHEVGITFVYVTHDQEEAFFMSDRVAIMNGSVIEQIGSAEDVYVRPRTPFVADFVGTSNRFGGTVVAVAGDGRYDVELDGVGRAVVDGVAGLAAGDAVLAIVRPEAIAPVDGGLDGALAFTAQIADAAYLGPHVSCRVERADGWSAHITMPSRRQGHGLVQGEERRFGWDRDATWLVPAP